jgi:hypothetical protein
VSISPTFYKLHFSTKVFYEALLSLQFGFVIFWRKNIGIKAAHKIYILGTAFTHVDPKSA